MDVTKLQSIVSDATFSWLSSKASLTKKLREFTNNQITHHLFYDEWGDAPEIMRNILNIETEKKVWIRNMEWRLKESTWLACTVIIPHSSITSETAVLQHIGKNSIGDVLFQDPTLRRSDFTFIKENDGGWSRHSIFYFHQQPLFLYETFFPEFFHAIEN